MSKLSKLCTSHPVLTLALTFIASISGQQLAHADTPQTLAYIEQIKNLAPGEVPKGVTLASKQDFHASIGDNPTTFDPQLVNDSITQAVINPVFDPLIRHAENGQYIPCAAESYDISNDGKTWTFHLRPQAKWQDGKPITAQDFVYAFQRLTDPKTAALNGNYLELAHVVNARKVNLGELPVTDLGVKALDDYTFQIQLDSPTPWLLQMLTMYGVAPVRKDLIEKYGKTWANVEHLVGNGPFKVVRYNPNDQVILQKWNGYWDAKNIHLNNITYDVIKNGNSTYLKYISGDLDVVSTNATNAVLARKNYPEQVITAPINGVAFFAFDVKQVPQVVRHAIALVVDTKFLVSKILKSNIATTRFLPPSVQEAEGATEAAYFNQDLKTRREQAIKELEAAGYTPEHPYTITLLHKNTSLDNIASNAFRAWITQGTGGRIIYKDLAQETKSFYESANDGKHPFIYEGWVVSYDQASNFYNSLRCSDPWDSFHYCNKEYDDTVTAANHSLDRAERVELYKKANALLQRDLPVVPLFRYTSTNLRKPYVGGYNPEVFPTSVRDLYIIEPKTTK